MIQIMLHGARGRMGLAVTQLILARPDRYALCAKIDPIGGADVDTALEQCGQVGDVIIDFSHHSSVNSLLSYAVQHRIPLVIGTTGHTRDELEQIQLAAREIPIFHTANLSVGIALLTKLASLTAKVFPDCDVEIIETHHNQKADAPSGTALMLAQAVQQARPDAYAVYGRSGMGKRDPNEIGVHAVRRGSIVGEHQLFFTTDSQTVTLTHTAHSRSLFAEGAISAAAFLVGRVPGLYSMQDLLAD